MVCYLECNEPPSTLPVKKYSSKIIFNFMLKKSIFYRKKNSTKFLIENAVKFCSKSPVQLPNNSGAGPPVTFHVKNELELHIIIWGSAENSLKIKKTYLTCYLTTLNCSKTHSWIRLLHLNLRLNESSHNIIQNLNFINFSPTMRIRSIRVNLTKLNYLNNWKTLRRDWKILKQLTYT